MKIYSDNHLYTIYIIDDNPVGQAYLNSAVREIIPDAIIKPFSDCIDALEYLFESSQMPDLIFLDLNSGKLGGKSMLTIIKHNEPFRTIPIVTFTKDPNNHEKEIIIRLGAKAYYFKPDSRNELVKIVEVIKNEFFAPPQLLKNTPA